VLTIGNTQKFYHASIIEIPANSHIRKYSCSGFWIKTFRYVQNLLSDLDKCGDKAQVDILVSNGINNLDSFSKSEKIDYHSPIAEVFSFFMREVIAEQVRSEYFPLRPNRQKSIFVVDDIEAVMNFNRIYHEGKAIIYECIPLKPNTVFKADMNLINHSRVDEVNPSIFKQNMFTYWEAKDPIKIQEILCPCPVVVLDRVI